MKNGLIGFVVGILVFLGGLWTYQQLKAPTTPSPSPALSTSTTPETNQPKKPETVPVSTWKTYTNSTYHYSFQYDSTWFLSEAQAPDVIIITNVDNRIKPPTEDMWLDMMVGHLIYKASSLTDLEQQLRDNYHDVEPNLQLKTVTIGENIPAFLWSQPAGGGAPANDMYYFLSQGAAMDIVCPYVDEARAKAACEEFLKRFSISP